MYLNAEVRQSQTETRKLPETASHPCSTVKRAILLHITGGPNNARQEKNPYYCTILDAIWFTLSAPEEKPFSFLPALASHPTSSSAD